MQKEFIGSALIHGGLVVGALIFMGLPRQDDAPAMGSVTVDIVSSSLVTRNESESIESDATETLVLSGAQTVTTDSGDAPTFEPVVSTKVDRQTESIEPLSTTVVEPLAVETLQPPEATDASDSLTAPVETLVLAALNSQAAEPVESSPVLEPVEISDKPKRVEPAMPVPRPADLVVARPAPTPSKPEPTSTQAAAPQQSGDGGDSGQTSAAARSAGGEAGQGTGGSADDARYPGQVERKVARALRYPNDARGARGEVLVVFTVDASGSLLTLGIGRSSGDAILDQAALTTVQRAAPFPAFPAGSARTVWDFSIPLAFSRN